MSDEKQNYQKLHHDALVADLHCDTVIPMRRGYDIAQRHDCHHIDLPRLQEGGIDIQVFAACCNLVELETSSRDHVIESLDLLRSELGKYPDQIEICLTTADILKARAANKIAGILAIEGGLALDSDSADVEYFYNKGVRLITISHETPTGWCANWKEQDTGVLGLTDLGREIIAEMNRLGMIIDLSHSSDNTVAEVLKIADRPVIASHSGARSLCGHRRNLTDEQIKAIAASGGMIGVTFVNNFISEKYNNAYNEFWNTISAEQLKSLMRLYSSPLPDDEYQQALQKDFGFIIDGERKLENLRVAVKDVVDHIDHMVSLVGPDYVGIGSDFDGMSSTPIGLEDCSKLANITKELAARNYSEIDIKKILGGNILRVFAGVCG